LRGSTTIEASMREHEIVAAFSARLPLRPDAERVREQLAAAAAGRFRRNS
jgi:hypothetical protein